MKDENIFVKEKLDFLIPVRAVILVIVLALRVIIIAEIIESVMGF